MEERWDPPVQGYTRSLLRSVLCRHVDWDELREPSGAFFQEEIGHDCIFTLRCSIVSVSPRHLDCGGAF